MKLYLIYAKISKKDFINIKWLLRDGKSFMYVESIDKYTGLYAWTNKKSKLKDFMKLRDSSIYYTKTVEIKDNEYERFRHTNIEDMIEEKEFYILSTDQKNYLKEVILTCTRNEYNRITTDGDEFLYDFGYIKYNENYELFNNDIIDALDILGYTYEYDKHNDSRYDQADYYSSFGCSLNGHPIIDYHDSNGIIFMKLFEPLLIKCTMNEVCN